MLNILLVEPGYKNKYPPIGLMKISSYHKNRGDNVLFVKGMSKEANEKIWDRIYITTLFTFDFDIVVKTIKYYKCAVKNTNDIFVGGILASLMPDNLKKATGIENVIVGQLDDSKKIGYNDGINIDCIPLDYDILDEIEYKYPAGDNFFGYTTRGCPNKCGFCAVPKLEPEFKVTNNILSHIKEIREKHGDKKDLLLLDNNILNTPNLREIVDDIKTAGFVKERNYIEPLKYEIIYNRILKNDYTEKHILKLIEYLDGFTKRIKAVETKEEYLKILAKLKDSNDKKEVIFENHSEIMKILEKYRNRSKSQRYVDFNQGVDAELLTQETMSILSEIPIRPLRIAFDNVKEKDTYVKAIRLAHSYGVKELSNYMLYNFYDRPEELWERLQINIELSKELKLHLFSFPMKYMPIEKTNREHIGKYWNKKFLQSIPAILLVTRGIVADGESFFYKAFGRNIEEYKEILTMPKDFITYRSHFEKNGLTFKWKEIYDIMNGEERETLLKILCDEDVEENKKTMNVISILEYYKIRYKKEGVKNAEGS